jgi:hypothetical protein
MAKKEGTGKFKVAHSGISNEAGVMFTEGAVVSEAELGSTLQRHRDAGSIREMSADEVAAEESVSETEGRFARASRSELTTGNETATGAGERGKDGDLPTGSSSKEQADGGEEVLDELTVVDLRARARALNIEGASGLKKEELIEAITKAESDQAKERA